jgi:hypothetical protein
MQIQVRILSKATRRERFSFPLDRHKVLSPGNVIRRHHVIGMGLALIVSAIPELRRLSQPHV